MLDLTQLHSAVAGTAVVYSPRRCVLLFYGGIGMKTGWLAILCAQQSPTRPAATVASIFLELPVSGEAVRPMVVHTHTMGSHSVSIKPGYLSDFSINHTIGIMCGAQQCPTLWVQYRWRQVCLLPDNSSAACVECFPRASEGCIGTWHGSLMGNTRIQPDPPLAAASWGEPATGHNRQIRVSPNQRGGCLVNDMAFISHIWEPILYILHYFYRVSRHCH